jgi:hypothetical protein
MKKIISIITFSLMMNATLMAQYKTAADKNSRCGGCGLAATGIFAYKYITDNNINYKVTSCVPFSDIEIYSSPSGGDVVAYATADEKGEAIISLSEKITVAFALNHSRVNEKGFSGKGQIYSLMGNPVLDIQSPVLSADNANSVIISWKANSFGAGWDFNVQRSLNGKNFVPVANIASGNSGASRTYDTKNAIAESGSGAVYYRIEARNSKTGAVIQTAVKDLNLPKPALFTAINYNNQVRIHFSNGVSYPATYTLTDMQGIKIATGILKSNDQVIDISSYRIKNYILAIADSKNNSGSQMLFKN